MDGCVETGDDVPLCLNPDNMFNHKESHVFPLPATSVPFVARLSFMFDVSVIGKTNKLFSDLLMGNECISEPPKGLTWLALRSLALRKCSHVIYKSLGERAACITLTELHQLLSGQQYGRLGLLPTNGRKVVCFVPIGDTVYAVECNYSTVGGWCVEAYGLNNKPKPVCANNMVLYRGYEP